MKLIIDEDLKAHKDGDKVFITEQAIQKVHKIEIPGYEELTGKIYEAHKGILRESKNCNNSNEVAKIICKDGDESNYICGDVNTIDIEADFSVYHWLRNKPERNMIICHNHPGLSYFSLQDLRVFYTRETIGAMTIITNRGNVSAIYKAKTLSFNNDVVPLIERLSIKWSGGELVEKMIKESYDFGVRKYKTHVIVRW